MLKFSGFLRGVLPLDSKLKVFSGILLLTAGLSACGTNGAIDNGNNTRPIGYYSNDADRNNGLDNDGPVTEMLENMNGRNGATNVNNRARNGNPFQQAMELSAGRHELSQSFGEHGGHRL